jgi:HlyD family secretion protein
LARPDGPAREIWFGVTAIAVFIVLIGLWAAFARLDEGITAAGQVVVSGSRQAVQSKDGGVVGRLLVKEGDAVRVGQVLLEIDVGELRASAQALSNSAIQQQALEDRLNTEMQGLAHISRRADLAQSAADLTTAKSAGALQALEFSRRRIALESERDVLQQQIDQIVEQMKGYDRQLQANRRQRDLIQQERDSLKELFDKGLVPASRMRQLDRSQADLEGAAGQYEAERSRSEQEIGEHRIKMQGLLAERDADDSRTYREAEMALAELRPKLAAAQKQIDRAIIRAPATGKVVGLSIFTVGGVVAPGQKLMEIVPEGRALVVAARVKPTDAEDLRIGQRAEVRISAFHGARVPTISGRVTRISADALSDEKSGQSFFTIEVQVAAADVARLGDVAGADAELRPGLPAEVVLPLRARSAATYLLEPLGRSLWKSFRQH